MPSDDVPFGHYALPEGTRSRNSRAADARASPPRRHLDNGAEWITLPGRQCRTAFERRQAEVVDLAPLDQLVSPATLKLPRRWMA